MRTVSKSTLGETFSAKVAWGLVKAGMWFTMTPLPDDYFEFTVKAEEQTRLDGVILATVI